MAIFLSSRWYAVVCPTPLPASFIKCPSRGFLPGKSAYVKFSAGSGGWRLLDHTSEDAPKN
jgi:hypothetical protein